MKEVLWSLTTTMNKHNKKSLIQTIEPFNRPVMILAKNSKATQKENYFEQVVNYHYPITLRNHKMKRLIWLHNANVTHKLKCSNTLTFN